MRILAIFLIASSVFGQAVPLRGTASPGIFDDSQYQSAIDGRTGTSVDPITARQEITNTAGKRPSGVNGMIKIPAASETYEADGVSGIALNNSPMTNGVGLSGFAAVTSTPPTGTVNTSGTAVTWVSGTVFDTNWDDNVNKLLVINGTDYTIGSVNSSTSITLTSSAGVQSGVVYAKRIYVWSLNTLVTDWLPGKSGSPSYNWSYLTNEFDFNVGAVNTKVVAMSIGGASQAQPTTALGYLVNTLGSGILWGCGFCTLDGTASVAVQVGVSSTGNNAGSQPILLYSRDTSANVRATAVSNDPDGNLLIRTGFVNGGTANTQTVFQDGAGNTVAAIQGKVGGARGGVVASGTTRVQTGTDTFANLGAEGGGTQVFCSDCNVVSVAPHTCTSGGGGAMAFRSGGAWKCPF